MKSLTRALATLTLFAAVLGRPEARAQGPDVPLPPFYQQASELKPQGRLGQVLRRERIATSIPGAEAWRVAYVSSDALSRKTLVTGLVIAPKGPAPKGGRPIVAWAHGTTGTAQNCGPSQVIDPARELNQYHLIGGNSWTDYGVPGVEALIKLGYVVVATDYQGLGGGGGAHQYVVSTTQARDTIDSIRAVGALGLAGSNKRAVIYGWSQGGGTTLAAAASGDYLAAKGTVYDGVEMVGFVALAPQSVAAMAPPIADADKAFDSLLAPFTSDVGNFTHLAMTLWANAITFPNLKLTDVFTEDGAKAMNEILLAKCVHAAGDTISYNFGESYKTLLRDHPVNAAGWVKALVDGSGPLTKPIAPVIIYWGTKDVVNPPVMGQLYREKICQIGGNVARVQLAGEQTHFSTPVVSQPLFVPWIKDRFDGKPAPDGCSTGNN